MASLLSARWRKLCREHDAARAAYFKAFGVVNRKFMQIARGDSRENPSTEEIARFDATRKAWDNVKRRMKDFVKKHT